MMATLLYEGKGVKGKKEKVKELLDRAIEGNHAEGLLFLEEIVSKGKDIPQSTKDSFLVPLPSELLIRMDKLRLCKMTMRKRH